MFKSRKRKFSRKGSMASKRRKGAKFPSKGTVNWHKVKGEGRNEGGLTGSRYKTSARLTTSILRGPSGLTDRLFVPLVTQAQFNITNTAGVYNGVVFLLNSLEHLTGRVCSQFSLLIPSLIQRALLVLPSHICVISGFSFTSNTESWLPAYKFKLISALLE